MMKSRTLLAIAASTILIGGLCGAVLAAQNRGVLKVPGGLSFAEFKGYEAWQPVAVSQVPDGLKLISANAAMISAYRRGLPANGKHFPDGSKIAKIEWAPRPNPASPYPVTVPGPLMSVSFIEKDLKRFPQTHGWAYAQFLYDPKTGALKPNGTGAQCGYACHQGVAKQDYIFTAYPPR
jgi:hypothetical protein